MGGGLSARPAGAILAGGRATRLGGAAKGLLDVGGRRIVDLVAGALGGVTGRLLVVSEAPGAAEWLAGATVVRDRLTGGGSAAGVHAALCEAAGPVLVVAWDMPFVTSAVLRALLMRTGEPDGSGCDALVPRGRDGQLQPLCAWYGLECVPAIERGWTEGDRSMHALLRRVKTTIVEVEALCAPEESERLFFNVNTPHDLDLARAMVTHT